MSKRTIVVWSICLVPSVALALGCSSEAAEPADSTAGGSGEPFGGSSGASGQASAGSPGASGQATAGASTVSGGMGGTSVSSGGSPAGGSPAGGVGGAAMSGMGGGGIGGSAGTASGSSGTASGGAGGSLAGSAGAQSAAGGADSGSGGGTGGAGSGGVPPVAGSGGQDTQGDTWETFAQDFFESYCVSCHNDDGTGVSARDYHDLARVILEKEAIACGVSKSQEDWTARGCTNDLPSPNQFPAGNGAKPTDAERDRLLAWIDAGTP